jgi:hypothetical protein
MIVREEIMNKILKQFLFWTPRIAGILFIAFISLFALDVFDLGLGFWGTIVALVIHLIPSILLAVAIVIAWRQEWVGAVGFIGWGVWYLLSARGFGWDVYVLIAGIPALIGFLFLADWIWRKQLRAG